MANLRLFDRVKMSVSGTPGTGTITLGSAATGFRTFAGAGVANTDSVSYLIEDGTNWEFGRGTYTSSGTTMSRDTVIASSAGGTTKISATSSAFVYLTALAADLVQFDSAGNVGIGTSTPAVKLDVSATDAMRVPVGTTAQRPTGATGYVRYNTTTGAFEGYDGANWNTLIAAPNIGAFGVYGSANQTGLASGAYTKVTFNTEEFDTNSNFDSTTNYRFTPTVAGYYQINFAAYISGASGNLTAAELLLYKNGTAFKVPATTGAAASLVIFAGSNLIYLNGSTDYIEFYVYATTATGTYTINAGQSTTFASGYLARPA